MIYNVVSKSKMLSSKDYLSDARSKTKERNYRNILKELSYRPKSFQAHDVALKMRMKPTERSVIGTTYRIPSHGRSRTQMQSFVLKDKLPGN